MISRSFIWMFGRLLTFYRVPDLLVLQINTAEFFTRVKYSSSEHIMVNCKQLRVNHCQSNHLMDVISKWFNLGLLSSQSKITDSGQCLWSAGTDSKQCGQSLMLSAKHQISNLVWNQTLPDGRYQDKGFHPASFGLPRPFRSVVRSSHTMDRQTDTAHHKCP